jgi:hypothetical protein
MDNIIEIIVTFFVIYSILGGLFGKKKKPQPQQQKQQQRQRPKPVQYRQQSDKELQLPQKPKAQDILEELFGLKLPKTEDEYSYSTKRSDDNLEYQSWDPQREFEKKVETKERFEYRNIEKVVPDVDYDKLGSLETERKKVKISDTSKIYEQRKSFSKRTLDIKTKLKDPQTFRELYIISEIINKPKALKRS